MNEHENAEAVRELCEAFNAWDVDRCLRLFADDIVWHYRGDNLVSGTYRGKGELRGLFNEFQELFSGTAVVEVEDILADDRYAVGFLRISGQREGSQLNARLADFFEFDDTGKFTQLWFLPAGRATWDSSPS